MSEYEFTQYDFENPSFLEKFLEKTLKNWWGTLVYGPYVDSFNLKGDENVLDFGCGDGIGSRDIIKKLSAGGSLTCLDISSYWLNITKKRLSKYNNVNFLRGDIRLLDLEDLYFDRICIIHVLHDINPLDRQEVVSSLSKKLKRSGKIHIFEPIKYSHGMAIKEIKELMNKVGLIEEESLTKKSWYKGVFQFKQ